MTSLAWSWPQAGFGAVLALPAGAVIPFNSTAGLALAVGMLPTGAFGLVQPRGARVRIFVVGAVSGLSMLIGGVLAQAPALAVPAVFGLSVLAALSAARWRLGALAMMLCLPLTGIGLSFDVGTAAKGAALLTVGSAYACCVALLWPDRPARPRPPTPSPCTGMLSYGVRLGLAGAIAAGIGFAFDLEHVGWACGAALLVMRPAREVLLTRAAGRAMSVTVGATAAAALGAASPVPAVLAAAVFACLAALSATRASRWYVTPAFTTFIVFLLLLDHHPEEATARFLERVVETLIGVALALFFGAVLPWAAQRPARSRPEPGGS